MRKRIKKATTPQGAENKFKDERDCLELYHSLRHPNIIPLLGSFTLGGNHNLLFPYFCMDLDAFLAGERFGKFCDNATFTAAVADLASALQSVHEVNLRSRTKPIYRTSYGYHHDIRPANILVTDTTFILADFGLAYPKPQAAHEPPVTTWVENIGQYIAPECMDEFFEPRVIGRSYDIWAFGCLLSEIATYMELGPAGIEEFRAKRTTPTFYDNQWINGYFFEGRSSNNQVSLKDGVSDWLQALSKEPRDRIIPSLVALSEKMLHPDPESRSAMAISCIRLSFIHAKRLFWSAVESIERTLSELGRPRLEVSPYTTTELKIELSKLKAFGDVLGINDTMRLDCKLFTEPSFAKFVKQCLEGISTELRRFRTSLPNYMRVWTASESQPGVIKELVPLKLIDEPIRQDIRKLCESLPDQGYFNDFFIKNFLASSRSEDSLRDIEMCWSESPELYADIGLHAKLQRLNQALQRKKDAAGTEGQDLILDWSRLDIRETFSRNHHLGIYDTGGEVNRCEPQRVLIEWVLFSQFPEGEPVDARIQKLLELAELLHCPKPEGFRTLDCLGFLPPEPDKRGTQGYGFVYPFPTNTGSTNKMHPKTLRQLLDTKLADWSITLGDKFNIAKALSSSLCQLHRHDWLHKNIRSDNIIFFADEKEQGDSRKAAGRLNSGPYLVGFHHGRRDGQGFCSDVPSVEADPEALLYQHPEYKYDINRFQKAYDHYSLGIILLEVAFWRPAQKIRENELGFIAGEEFQKKLVAKYVPKLAEVMGNAYMDATMACLSSGFGSKEETTGVDDVSQFYLDVIKKLDACHVG